MDLTDFIILMCLVAITVVAAAVWWVARHVPGSPESKLACRLGLHDLNPRNRMQCRCQRCDALFVAELRKAQGRRLMVWRRVKGEGLGSTRD